MQEGVLGAPSQAHPVPPMLQSPTKCQRPPDGSAGHLRLCPGLLGTGAGLPRAVEGSVPDFSGVAGEAHSELPKRVRGRVWAPQMWLWGSSGLPKSAVGPPKLSEGPCSAALDSPGMLRGRLGNPEPEPAECVCRAALGPPGMLWDTPRMLRDGSVLRGEPAGRPGLLEDAPRSPGTPRGRRRGSPGDPRGAGSARGAVPPPVPGAEPVPPRPSRSRLPLLYRRRRRSRRRSRGAASSAGRAGM